MAQMVTRSYTANEEEEELHYQRAFSSRAHGYVMNHDHRDMPSTQAQVQAPSPAQGVYNASKHQYQSPPSNRKHTQDNESNSGTRRRVPLACGRCRKRKIRCSGDQGNGGACNNCRTSGVSQPCQFLRVQSNVLPMKSEVVALDYDLSSTGRTNCRQPIFTPQAYGQQNTVPLEVYPYRNHLIPSFSQYQVNQVKQTPMYDMAYEFGDPTLEYNLEASTPLLVPPEQYTGFATSNLRFSTTTSAPTPPYSKSTSFLGLDGTYTNVTPSFPTTRYSVTSPDTKTVQCPGLPHPTSLVHAAPLANATVDRALPLPTSTTRSIQPPSCLRSDRPNEIISLSSSSAYQAVPDYTYGRNMKTYTTNDNNNNGSSNSGDGGSTSGSSGSSSGGSNSHINNNSNSNSSSNNNSNNNKNSTSVSENSNISSQYLPVVQQLGMSQHQQQQQQQQQHNYTRSTNDGLYHESPDSYGHGTTSTTSNCTTSRATTSPDLALPSVSVAVNHPIPVMHPHPQYISHFSGIYPEPPLGLQHVDLDDVDVHSESSLARRVFHPITAG